jgi:hypothetical protein
VQAGRDASSSIEPRPIASRALCSPRRATGRRDPLGNAETSAAVRAVIRALDRALPVRPFCLQARLSADHVTRQHHRRLRPAAPSWPRRSFAQITVEVRKLSANRAITICASLALAINHRHRRSTADLLQACWTLNRSTFKVSPETRSRLPYGQRPANGQLQAAI